MLIPEWVCVIFIFIKSNLFTSISPVSVLADLEVSDYLQPIVTSEIEEIEKPDARIFHIACQRAGVPVVNAAHVGDELVWSVHISTFVDCLG